MWFTARPESAYTTVSPTARLPASRWTARSHARHGMRSAIALLFPRIGVVVIAARLPVTGPVALAEADPREPLGALPEVQIRHERARRRAVWPRERAAGELVGDERARRERLGEAHVGRVAVRRLEDHVARAVLH